MKKDRWAVVATCPDGLIGTVIVVGVYRARWHARLARWWFNLVDPRASWVRSSVRVMR